MKWKDKFCEFKDGDYVQVQYLDGSAVYGFIVDNGTQYPLIKVAGRKAVVFMDKLLSVQQVNVGKEPQVGGLNAKVRTITDTDGKPSLVVDIVETKEQIEKRVREEEFQLYMKLLKANNRSGSMTAGMWLIFENDYYERGVCKDPSVWKKYLRQCDAVEAKKSEGAD